MCGPQTRGSPGYPRAPQGQSYHRHAQRKSAFFTVLTLARREQGQWWPKLWGLSTPEATAPGPAGRPASLPAPSKKRIGFT